MAHFDLTKLVQDLIFAALPILAVAVTTWILMQANLTWEQLKMYRPDVVNLINRAAEYVVPFVEQLKKNGKIPTNEEALEMAKEMVHRLMLTWNINTDTDKYVDAVWIAIERAVDEYNKQRDGGKLEVYEDPLLATE